MHLEELVKQDDRPARIGPEVERLNKRAGDDVIALEDLLFRRLFPSVLTGQRIDVEENRVNEALLG